MNIENFIKTFDDHLDLIDTEGDKPAQGTVTHNETSLDNTADIRDILSSFAATGYSGMKKEDASANFQRLSVLVGKPIAIKLINNVDIFSQRNDIKGKSPQERIELFYNLGSDDKEVSDVLKKVKSFGYGVVQGLNTSPDITNKKITGEIKDTDKKNTASLDKTKQLAAKIIPQ